MLLFGKLINKDYAWELSLFYKYRDFSDGLSIVEHIINWDRFLADHSPSFEWSLRLFNFTIFEFNIYYIHHRNED